MRWRQIDQMIELCPNRTEKQPRRFEVVIRARNVRHGTDYIINGKALSDIDAIIVGAGHNGLTCAAYLGMAGLRVRVFERRGVVGGACVTEEFHPGFRNSTAAYTVGLLQPKIIRDLKLYEYGLRVSRAPRAELSAAAGWTLSADWRRSH